jgi:Zn finger protein HypA/HybF involved in hydrogenase expression
MKNTDFHATAQEIKLTCEGCGVKMKLTFVKQTGYNEKEFFNCPACQYEHCIRAALPIQNDTIIILS